MSSGGMFEVTKRAGVPGYEALLMQREPEAL